MTNKMHTLIGRMTETRRLKWYAAGYLLGLGVTYFVSSVIRLISGTPAPAAWHPNSALIGLWAGFALWIVTAAVLSRHINRTRSRNSR